MKICIAQTESLKGEIQNNIQNHLLIIERAIELNADLIIFPELSITGYEPDLAATLATNLYDSIFNPFQELADQNEITIGIGMPTQGIVGINISMLIFQSKEKRTIYCKQMLHSDEHPYFICGTNQTFLKIKDQKIAIGICYETLQREHFLNANKNGAAIYIASVAKAEGGIKKAFSHFSKIANEFSTPILISNCVGYCDNFLSVGQSAAWNKKGELLAQLDNSNQGLLIYNTDLETTEIYQLILKMDRLDNIIFQKYNPK